MTYAAPFDYDAWKLAAPEEPEEGRVCGATDSLVIHHIDGNHDNNSPDNLTCLCDRCHSKAHNETRRRDTLGRYTS